MKIFPTSAIRQAKQKTKDRDRDRFFAKDKKKRIVNEYIIKRQMIENREKERDLNFFYKLSNEFHPFLYIPCEQRVAIV